MSSARVRALRGQRDAEEMQPWRCAVCGVAVRRGYNDPCACAAVAAPECNGTYPDAPDHGGDCGSRNCPKHP